MVDHSITRAMEKGAPGSIEAAGAPRADIFQAMTPVDHTRTGGH